MQTVSAVPQHDERLGASGVASRRRSITNSIITGSLLVAGLIHLLPAVGILGADVLDRLYGTETASADVEVLLRHRAVLFAILGVATLTAAILRRAQITLLVINLVSVATFALLASVTSGTSPEIDRVTAVDVVLAGAIMIALSARGRDHLRR